MKKRKVKEKTELLNGCYRTELSVFPTNWETQKASLKKDWYVWCRYSDPLHKTKYPNGKLVPIKGMNEHKTLEKRREATLRVLEEQRMLYDVYNYNPITDRINSPLSEEKNIPDDVTSQTEFILALRSAYKRLKYVKHTLDQVRYVIDGIESAAKALGFDKLHIELISRKHIIRMFEYLAKSNIRFSVNRRNVYRAYLLQLFNNLLDREACSHNPIASISVMAEADDESEPIPEDDNLLTPQERKEINDHLFHNCYTFWRYTQIFFHSGCRSTELLLLKEKRVDIAKQQFWIRVKKRKKWVWVARAIKDIVLPLWNEILSEARLTHEKINEHGTDLFLFSIDLRPGVDKIGEKQITLRWRRWVKAPRRTQQNKKNGLGINKKFYDLKALHSTEMMDILSDRIGIESAEKEVAEINAHTSTEMVQKVYDKKNVQRKQNRIKGIRNSFA